MPDNSERKPTYMSIKPRRKVPGHDCDIASDTDWSSVVTCPYGNCDVYCCEFCGRVLASFGGWLCPCDLTRGWKAQYLSQMGKPHPPVKAKHGKHLGKVQRKQREMREVEQYIDEITRGWDDR